MLGKIVNENSSILDLIEITRKFPIYSPKKFWEGKSVIFRDGYPSPTEMTQFLALQEFVLATSFQPDNDLKGQICWVPWNFTGDNVSGNPIGKHQLIPLKSWLY